MITKYRNKRLQINKQVNKFPPGSVIPVRVDENGIMTDRVLRKKLKDAKIDGCVSFAKRTKTQKTTKKGD